MTEKSREILERLIKGNEQYRAGKTGNISEEVRKETALCGQKPIAAVIGCSDSRAVPEFIFGAGIGELFVVRSAGNVALAGEMASINYAVDHLGCGLVIVLGHDRCGAVGAAMNGNDEQNLKCLVSEITPYIREERDYDEACRKNARAVAENIRKCVTADVVPCLYRTATGKVEFI